jgi:acyl-CoA thioesterase
MMDRAVKKTLLAKLEEAPYPKKLGIRILEVDTGYSRVEMEVKDDLMNILETLHGGAIFSLIDEALQAASNSHGSVAVALNVNISYLSPPESGSVLIAEAREIHLTKKTGHYEVKVRDEMGRLIAISQAITYRKGTPLPFL